MSKERVLFQLQHTGLGVIAFNWIDCMFERKIQV